MGLSSIFYDVEEPLVNVIQILSKEDSIAYLEETS